MKFSYPIEGNFLFLIKCKTDFTYCKKYITIFRFLFTFLLTGLALIIVVTGWRTLDYTQLRVSITTLFSLNILAGLGYWIYLIKTN